ncbi:MAG: monovalent cation/H+ antiporter subunit D family protein [Firmicutes bacterium]|nr:monovalent cation/H+ antiporter subunit D family protein [Bacillota bacterium]
MITESFRPLAAIAVSLFAAALIIIFGEKVKPNVREAITITASVIKAAFVFSMVPAVLAGKEYYCELWEIVDGISLAFRTDGAGMVFACIASGLWIVTSIYSIGYMRGHDEKNQTGYFAAFAVCLSSAIGIAFAANLITFFIFYEMLTIATYPLVSHYRNDSAKASGRKYLAYTLISGQLFFAAIAAIYFIYGTVDFTAGGFIEAGSMPAKLMLVLFVLMIGGGAVKAGVMPLHGWLPSAMVAPTPVSALLHAVAVVKAGAFCVLRVVCYVFGPEAAGWCGGSKVLSWLAVCTIILSSCIAMRKDNLKARLAFSTIGQLSYIVLGISVLAPFSILGAVFHIVAHAFLKITLFMCAGAIYVTTHLSEISSMSGLSRRMPVTATCFTAASLGIAGLPLLAGFVSKMNIIRGAFLAGQPLFVATLVAAALLALSYLIPVVRIFFGRKVTSPALQEKGEASKAMLIPIVITAVVSFVLGVMPNAALHLYDFAAMAAEAIAQGGGPIA